MMLLVTLGSPLFTDASQRSEWDRQAKAVFDDYVALSFGEEASPRAREESEMLKFYEEKIKSSKPILKGDSSRSNLSVSNLPSFLSNNT